MYLQTRETLKKALDEDNQDLVKVITLYDALGWEQAGYPWPGPPWLRRRFETWRGVEDWLMKLAKIKVEGV